MYRSVQSVSSAVGWMEKMVRGTDSNHCGEFRSIQSLFVRTVNLTSFRDKPTYAKKPVSPWSAYNWSERARNRTWRLSSIVIFRRLPDAGPDS